MATIGKRLKTWRKDNHLSMKNIEDATGIGTSNISAIENDKIQPSSKTLLALKSAYDLSIDWILTGEIANIREDKPIYNATDNPRYLPILKLLEVLDDRELIKLEHEIENAIETILNRRDNPVHNR